MQKGGVYMDAVITAITQVTSVVSSCFTMLTGNAYTTFILAASVVGIGLGIFKHARHAA